MEGTTPSGIARTLIPLLPKAIEKRGIAKGLSQADGPGGAKVFTPPPRLGIAAHYKTPHLHAVVPNVLHGGSVHLLT